MTLSNGLDPANRIVINGILCWDMGNYGEYNRTTHSWAVWELVMFWTDLPYFINNLFAAGQVIGGIYYFGISFAYPNAPWLRFHSAPFEGIVGEGGITNDSNNISAYKYAKVKLRFEQLDYFEGGFGETPETGELSADINSTSYNPPQSSGGFFYWADNTPVNASDAPPISYPSGTIFRTVENVVNFPSAMVTSLLRCCNQKPFLGFDPGTILFAGYRTQKRFVGGGNSTNYKYTLRFEYNGIVGTTSKGWNYFPRPYSAGPPKTGGNFDEMFYNNGSGAIGNNIFPPVDLSPLLDPSKY